ncbi:ABC transporter ATP-binding protein/permease [Alicyclobacillus fastidiosus]|uniref:ABC transporter ATP-binding protein/permease n=1 Tax=Alicyclobacillus fastidiosus TaxID=392011 RepID=A0ABY6ZAL1_9BACL|nr:ABC transporter ATP-binding protein [Alicyclobacillus fastidiosus]WAH39775.1 ABC transporter ATP-binding protein/permease [Alicyclobacillus fastidiosus]
MKAKERFMNSLQMLSGIGLLCTYIWNSGKFSSVGLAANTILSGLLPALDIWVLGQMVNAVANWVAGHSATSHPAVSFFHAFLPWLVVLILLRMLKQSLSSLGDFLESYLQEQLTYHLETDLLVKAARMSLAHFEDGEFHDQLTRAKNGMGLGLVNLFYMVRTQVQTLVTVGGLIAVTVKGYWLIPILVICSSLPTLRLQTKFNINRYEMYFGHTPKNRLMQYLVQVLIERDAAKEVRLFGLGLYLSNRWRALYEEVRKETVHQASKHRLILFAVGLIPAVAFGSSLALVIWTVVDKRLVVGAAVAVVYAVQQLQQQVESSIRNAGHLHDLYMRFWGDTMTFLRIPEQPWERSEPTTATERESIPHVPIALNERWSRTMYPEPKTIVAERVTFSYPGSSTPAVQDVTFTVKPGEKIALLGENGAGKSTLVKLLLGLYEPMAGVIQYGDVDIRAIHPDALWNHVSTVFQDFSQFHLSAQENIGFGQLSRMNSLVAVKEAAVGGGAADFIEAWEDKYETLLGPTFGGRDLSGGQWQKIATSRGFMRQPYFLILDEPTAALDPIAEMEVYRRFQEMAGDRTALLISHRIGFARLADRILVMKEGRLIESGTHQELIQTRGEYYKLLEIQSQWYK